MDGTLVDSEAVHDEGFRQVFKKYHLDVTDEQILSWHGTGVPGLIKNIIRIVGDESFAIKLLDESIVYLEDELLAGRFYTFKGAKALLQFCKDQGLIVGLATSSLGEWGKLVVSKTGIEGYFDFMLFGDDVINMKPAPDIYHLAIERAGVNREECLVFEDSLVGVEAAHKAGLRVVQICHGQQSDLTQEHISSLDEAKAIVKKALGS